MHTLAVALRPAKIARTPVPANDTDACWTSDPRAQQLLASCTMRPPVGVEHHQRYGFEGNSWFSYTGRRFEALSAIRDEIGARMLAHYEQHGEAAYEPFRLWCRQPDVTAAIDAAIVAQGEC